MKTLRDLDLRHKRTLIRVDFNVPIADGHITDDTRIRASLPTIRVALNAGAKVILASHLGRPKGERNPKYSLKPVADRLAELLDRPVAFAPDCVGSRALEVITSHPGAVILLENLRFHKEEEANDATFAAELADLADVYINDAFGAAHRAHASTEGIVQFVPEHAAGLLLASEVDYLTRVLTAPERPFVAILGGSKVSGKLDVIKNLLAKVNALLIGGAMAYTFFKARGLPVGSSLVEDDLLDEARQLEERAALLGVRLQLPVDHVVAAELRADAPAEVMSVDDPAIGDRKGLDIGPRTIEAYGQVIGSARTIVWNGPMGVFELAPFAAGTMGVASSVAASAGTTIIGGGDTIAAVTQAGVADRITHISTGGGASLEFLGGRTLPGVAALL